MISALLILSVLVFSLSIYILLRKPTTSAPISFLFLAFLHVMFGFGFLFRGMYRHWSWAEEYGWTSQVDLTATTYVYILAICLTLLVLSYVRLRFGVQLEQGWSLPLKTFTRYEILIASAMVLIYITGIVVGTFRIHEGVALPLRLNGVIEVTTLVLLPLYVALRLSHLRWGFWVALAIIEPYAILNLATSGSKGSAIVPLAVVFSLTLVYRRLTVSIVVAALLVAITLYSVLNPFYFRDAIENRSDSSRIVLVDESAGLVDEGTAPVDEGTAPVDESAGPVEESAGPVDEGTAPVDESVVPVEDSVGLVEESVGLVEESAGPVDESVGLVEESAGPVDESVVPVEDSVGLVEESAGPVDEGTAPVDESVVPVEESVGLVEESVGLVEESVGLVKGSVGLVKESVQQGVLSNLGQAPMGALLGLRNLSHRLTSIIPMQYAIDNSSATSFSFEGSVRNYYNRTLLEKPRGTSEAAGHFGFFMFMFGNHALGFAFAWALLGAFFAICLYVDGRAKQSGSPLWLLPGLAFVLMLVGFLLDGNYGNSSGYLQLVFAVLVVRFAVPRLFSQRNRHLEERTG